MQPGLKIAERFVIEASAGRGGMGEVFRARDYQSGELVALKILSTPQQEAVRRFAREAVLLAQLKHPGIVRYVTHGQTPEGQYYLVMEWLEGEDLAKRLRRGALTPGESINLLRRIAEALAVAHAQGIVHRDLKPQNIFLPGHKIESVKILDFGIAGLDDASHTMTAAGVILGTPGYMAPEQINRGALALDARVDIFALGCVFFECLTGRAAFTGASVMAILAKIVLQDAPRVRTLRTEVPQEVDELVARMLSKKTEDRPSDGKTLARELGRLEEQGEEYPPKIAEIAEGASLTGLEQRLFCVVLLGLGDTHDGPSNDTFDAVGADKLQALVERFGGRLISMINGSVVVVFLGAGVVTDQAKQAARCALALREQLHEPPMVVAMGRGSLSGEASLPIGEVIDRAAALLDQPLFLSQAKHPIRIDQTTAGLLGLAFEIGGDADGFILRGERVPLEHLEIEYTLLGKPTPFVGRERELRDLTESFEECISESLAGVMLVTAAAGVGKSRLVHEFIKTLTHRTEECTLLLARGDPSRAGSSFGLLAQAVRLIAGISDGEPLAIQRRKLEARISRYTPSQELSHTVEFLGELIGAPFPDESSVQLRAARQDLRLMGDQMLRAFEAWLLAECTARPVLVVLENFHWGDLPSAKFLDAALRTLKERPLFVLALGRPEVHELFPKLWSGRRLTEMKLGELTRRMSEKLVRAVLGTEVPSEVVAKICQQSGGNAFFLEELIRVTAQGRSGDLPETVLAMVEARLLGLSSEERRLLRAASIFGESFWAGGVATLLGESMMPSALSGYLATLWEHELLQPRRPGRFPMEEEYIFRHALLRESAYAMLTEKDRVLGHRLAGDWLEKTGETEAIVLAEHFEKGGQPERAIAFYQRAAEQALGGNDFTRALNYAERGISCGAQGEPRGHLLLLLTQAYGWRGDNGQMKQCGLEAMRHLPPGAPLWYKAAGQVAVASNALGDHSMLSTLAQELLSQESSQLPSWTEIFSGSRVAFFLQNLGRAELAEALFARIQEREFTFHSDTTNREVTPLLTAQFQEAHAFRVAHEGDVGSLLEHSERAAECFEEAGAFRSATTPRMNAAFAHIEVGDYRHAERGLRSLLSQAERMGLQNVARGIRQNLGLALTRLGDLTEARTIEAEAVAAYQAQGYRRMEGISRIYLAQTILQLGDLEGAEQEALTAVAVSKEHPSTHACALATVARVLLSLNLHQASLAAAREAMEILEKLKTTDEGEAQIRLVFAEALLATGEQDEARSAIQTAHERLLARAEKIKNPQWRHSFLENVPENAQTISLASRAVRCGGGELLNR